MGVIKYWSQKINDIRKIILIVCFKQCSQDELKQKTVLSIFACPQNKEEIDSRTNSHPTNRKQMLFLSHLSAVCLPERATLRCFYACTKLLTDDYFSQQMSLSTVTYLIKLA